MPTFRDGVDGSDYFDCFVRAYKVYSKGLHAVERMRELPLLLKPGWEVIKPLQDTALNGIILNLILAAWLRLPRVEIDGIVLGREASKREADAA